MSDKTQANFTAWMAENSGIKDAALGEALSGGNANVTRMVETPTGRYVLRHPPVHTVSEKAAAGIQREHRLLSALDGQAPVAHPIAFCDDASIIGAPFLVVDFVDGVSMRETLPEAYGDGVEAVDTIGHALVDALATVHTIDWRANLADDFGRPDGFVRRQIERWLAVRRETFVRDLPVLDQLGQWLLDNEPASVAPSVIHCDYHLDNCLFDRTTPKLNAIIDWEMATIGDPRVDLGLLLAFWRRDDARPLGFQFVQRVTNRPDAIPPETLAERWSKATGIADCEIDYFRAFAFWRLAAIVEGAWVLQSRGLIDSEYARALQQDVPALLDEAQEFVT